MGRKEYDAHISRPDLSINQEASFLGGVGS